MRIGELAARAGVNVETLRYYERRGLLPQPPRHPSGHRTYDDDAVRFVRAIKEAQALGFSLAEIEEYLRLARRGRRTASEALRIRLAAKIDEVDTKIASLHRVRDELARVVGCACVSLDHCTCGAAYLARRGSDPDASVGVLHVTNGESAGGTLRQTSIGGAVLPWQEVLHEGPVPPLPPARLRDVRARFLGECGWGSRRALGDAFERRDHLLVQALGERRHVVLWFEHDLYDQLQLLQVLALAGEVGFVEGRLELVQANVFLGGLAADELDRLWPERRPVTAAEVELARRAWDAVRAPEPTAIETLVHETTPALPYVAPALERLLEELPGHGDGLSRTERQLLEPLVGGPRTPHELFGASQAREEAVFLGDTWAWRRLAELADGARPLVARADGGALPKPPPLGDPLRFPSIRLALTGDGREVLAAKADRVELVPIDRWVGGIHLQSDCVWRWDRDERRCYRTNSTRTGRS